jgi:hypothetical protein
MFSASILRCSSAGAPAHLPIQQLTGIRPVRYHVGESAAPDDVVNPDLVAQLDTNGVVGQAPTLASQTKRSVFWL